MVGMTMLDLGEAYSPRRNLESAGFYFNFSDT
jgi:hypothetical protein